MSTSYTIAPHQIGGCCFSIIFYSTNGTERQKKRLERERRYVKNKKFREKQISSTSKNFRKAFVLSAFWACREKKEHTHTHTYRIAGEFSFELTRFLIFDAQYERQLQKDNLFVVNKRVIHTMPFSYE